MRAIYIGSSRRKGDLTHGLGQVPRLPRLCEGSSLALGNARPEFRTPCNDAGGDLRQQRVCVCVGVGRERKGVATGTREGAGSREVAARDVPGARALRGGPQAGLPAAGPPPGCVCVCCKTTSVAGRRLVAPCGGTGESLGGSQRRWSASAGPPWSSQEICSTAMYRAATSVCVCLC